MEGKQKLFEKIKKFISAQCGISETKIFENSCLEKDLGIYGDDAIELMIEYGKVFQVNVSEFLAADYFSPEAKYSPFLIKDSKKKELNIRQLMKGITAGKLNESVINEI